MTADEEAEKVVEASRLRMVGRIESFVPFADQSGRIARIVQMIGKRALIERQAELGFVAGVRIELVAETGLIASGQEAGSRGAAIGGRDIAVGAADAGGGQGVDIGRRHQLAAVDADVGVAQVIRDDNQNVRFAGGGCPVAAKANYEED